MRAKIRETERLCHIIIGAGAEAGDGVGIACMPGEHDDRRAPPPARSPSRLAAVPVGRPHIHNHESKGSDLTSARAATAVAAEFTEHSPFTLN